MTSNEPHAGRLAGLRWLLLAAALATNGCALEGVCVTPDTELGPEFDTCLAYQKRWHCDGEFHAYEPGDDEGSPAGRRTCTNLGFPNHEGAGYFRR